jgi:hypothetical protein
MMILELRMFLTTLVNKNNQYVTSLNDMPRGLKELATFFLKFSYFSARGDVVDIITRAKP